MKRKSQKKLKDMKILSELLCKEFDLEKDESELVALALLKDYSLEKAIDLIKNKVFNSFQSVSDFTEIYYNLLDEVGLYEFENLILRNLHHLENTTNSQKKSYLKLLGWRLYYNLALGINFD